jgi:hypothetical protein
MNTLSTQEREHILRLLGDGMSIRSIAALTGVSKNTVAKLLIDAGYACANYHDANVRGVRTGSADVTDIWSFAHAKHEIGAAAKTGHYSANDAWLRVISESRSKLIVSYRIGAHDAESAGSLMSDFETRLAASVNLKDVLLNFVEGPNLSLETPTRDVTQAADDFKRRVQNHASAVAFHIVCHNFVGTGEAGNLTPAMTAGISDRHLEFTEIATLVAQSIGTRSKQISYKKSL